MAVKKVKGDPPTPITDLVVPEVYTQLQGQLNDLCQALKDNKKISKAKRQELYNRAEHLVRSQVNKLKTDLDLRLSYAVVAYLTDTERNIWRTLESLRLLMSTHYDTPDFSGIPSYRRIDRGISDVTIKQVISGSTSSDDFQVYKAALQRVPEYASLMEDYDQSVEDLNLRLRTVKALILSDDVAEESERISLLLMEKIQPIVQVQALIS